MDARRKRNLSSPLSDADWQAIVEDDGLRGYALEPMRAVLATLAEEITDEQMAALGDAIEFADDCEDGADWCALTALHATLTELRKAAQ
jgi:hypothetical protein